MGKIWHVVTALAGLILAPFLAEGIHQILDEGPSWFPYIIVLVIASVALLAGEFTRGISYGLIVGILTFAILLEYSPGTVDWMNTEIPPPF